MLPLAHIGHYLWILYLVPVLFVIGGILYSTITGRRHRPEPKAASEQEDGGRGPSARSSSHRDRASSSAEDAPPAGGTGREVEDVNLARRPPSP